MPCLAIVVGIHVGDGAEVDLPVVPPFHRLHCKETRVAAIHVKDTGHPVHKVLFHDDRVCGAHIKRSLAGHEGKPFGLVGVDCEGADVVEAARPVVNGYQGAVVQPCDADIVGVGVVDIGNQEFLAYILCRQRLFYHQIHRRNAAMGKEYRPAAFEDGNALAVACLDAGAGQIHREGVHGNIGSVKGVTTHFYRPRKRRDAVVPENIITVVWLEQGIIFFPHLAHPQLEHFATGKRHCHRVARMAVCPVPVAQHDVHHCTVLYRHDVYRGTGGRHVDGGCDGCVVIVYQFPESLWGLDHILVAEHFGGQNIGGGTRPH